jgi:hypothetical protein
VNVREGKKDPLARLQRPNWHSRDETIDKTVKQAGDSEFRKSKGRYTRRERVSNKI